MAGRLLAYATPDELERVVSPDLLTVYRALDALPDPRFGPPRAEDKPGLAAPAHAITAAVGVTVAVSILGAPTIASAGEAMRWLLTGARERGLAVNATTIGWGQETTQVLAAAQLTALVPVLNPGDQLRYRIGTFLPRRPHGDAGRFERVAQRVPTMLWLEWSLRVSIPGCFQRQLRPALSMALLLVDTRVRLRDAAQLLHKQYVIEHRSLENIAVECGMSAANMARWAKVHNIPVRRLSRYDQHDLQANHRIPEILWRVGRRGRMGTATTPRRLRQLPNSPDRSARTWAQSIRSGRSGQPNRKRSRERSARQGQERASHATDAVRLKGGRSGPRVRNRPSAAYRWRD